jgi:hypothetical protein
MQEAPAARWSTGMDSGPSTVMESALLSWPSVLVVVSWPRRNGSVGGPVVVRGVASVGTHSAQMTANDRG